MSSTHRMRQVVGWWVASAAVGLLGCGGGEPALKADPSITFSPAQRDAKVQADLDGLQQQVQAYYKRYGDLPSHLPDLRDTPDGQPLLADVPLDPWRTPYMLRRLDRDVVLWTSGPDLIIGSGDDTQVRVSFDGVAQPSAQDMPAAGAPAGSP